MSLNDKGPVLNFGIYVTGKYNLVLYCLCPEMEEINTVLIGILERLRACFPQQ